MAAARRRKSKWDMPSTDDSTGNTNLSATDAAKERAAKLNAMLAAQGKLAKGTPPPAMGHPSPAAKLTAPPPSLNNGSKNLNQDLITAEVEINDSPARTLLCRGTTQDEINRYSGAAVSTRGKFMTEQEKMEAEGSGVKPLYLCIQGLTEQKVDLAVKRIREIMAGADMNSNPHSQPGIPQPQRMPVPSPMATPAFNQPLAIFDRQPLPPGMHYVQDKVFVGLDNALPEFNVKEKLQGPGVSYFQHICTQTGAKVQLRGRGSGFIEPTSGKEAFEALYIYISHGKVDGLAAAKKLVENLIQTVHTEYKAFEQTRRQQHYGYSPYMNVVNPPGQPPSGYQPPPYGYPHPPPPSNGYPQPAQHPPGPGYMYNHPPHTATPHQPPPPPVHPGVPQQPLRPHYGPPPHPVSGYPNHPPHPMPPRGPAPYRGYPPGPPHQGAPPAGPAPPGPHSEGPPQPPPPAPLLPPPVENEHRFQGQGPSASYQEQSQGGPTQSHEPPRRKFKEKIPIKASSMQDQTTSGPRHQESSILDPTLGEGTKIESERRPTERMPPPPAPLPRPKEHKFAPPPPPPPPDAMPPPVAPVRSRIQGKREAPSVSQPEAITKKQKPEGTAAVKSSAIASLAAYGEEDSSDEEGNASPEYKQESPQKIYSGESRPRERMPFWAVRR